MRVLSREGYALQTIDAAGLQGRGFRGKIQGLAAVPRSLWQSRGILRSFQPDVVIGVGGYASGPVVLAAWFLGVKTAIHEQNAFPGLSNRILGRVVDRIFISFADSGRHFPPSRTVLTGNPVRRRIRQAPPGPQSGGESPQRTSPFTLFVFGGSQGAHRLNEAMVEALEQLGDPQGGWRIIHQTGEKDFPRVKAAYAERGLTAEVEPFIEPRSMRQKNSGGPNFEGVLPLRSMILAPGSLAPEPPGKTSRIVPLETTTVASGNGSPPRPSMRKAFLKTNDSVMAPSCPLG